MCSTPPKSPTIVGSAVETIVWSRAASAIPAMIPTNTVWIWRCESVYAASWPTPGLEHVLPAPGKGVSA